jgi:hypothetical protein
MKTSEDMVDDLRLALLAMIEDLENCGKCFGADDKRIAFMRSALSSNELPEESRVSNAPVNTAAWLDEQVVTIFGIPHRAVFGKDGKLLAYVPGNEKGKKAHELVECVNAHDELVVAVFGALSAINTAEELEEIEEGLFSETQEKLRAILAKLEAQ